MKLPSFAIAGTLGAIGIAALQFALFSPGNANEAFGLPGRLNAATNGGGPVLHTARFETRESVASAHMPARGSDGAAAPLRHAMLPSPNGASLSGASAFAVAEAATSLDVDFLDPGNLDAAARASASMAPGESAFGNRMARFDGAMALLPAGGPGPDLASFDPRSWRIDAASVRAAVGAGPAPLQGGGFGPAPSMSAMPDTATWGTLLAGLAMVGINLRRRPRMPSVAS